MFSRKPRTLKDWRNIWRLWCHGRFIDWLSSKYTEGGYFLFSLLFLDGPYHILSVHFGAPFLQVLYILFSAYQEKMHSDIMVVRAIEVEVLALVGGWEKANFLCFSTVWVEDDSAVVIGRHLKERVLWKLDIASSNNCLNI